MARKSRSRGGGGDFLRLTLIAIGCFLAGAAGAWVLVHPKTKQAEPNTHAAAQADAEKPESVGKSGKSELEAEVKQLKKAIDDRDKQIADLMIQVKLQSAGSAAAGKPGI